MLRKAITPAVLTSCLVSVSHAGPVMEFENSVRSYITPDRYLRWESQMCDENSSGWVEPCAFLTEVNIGFAGESVPNPVTAVHVREDPADGWTPVPCPGLPAVTGECVVKSWNTFGRWLTVLCTELAVRTIYVRVTDALGQTVEKHIVIKFSCWECGEFPLPPGVTPGPPFDNEYFRDTEKYQNLPPPPPPEFEQPNMFFRVLNVSTPQDTVFQFQLEQEAAWPVTALLPSKLVLHPGESKLLPFLVQFPAVPETTQNRFSLHVWSQLDPSRVSTGQLTAVAPAVTAAPEEPVFPTLRVGGISPNPFHGTVELFFTLARPALVRLDVFDTRGRSVRRIHSREESGAGSIVWDGRDDRGGPSPSGVYFLELSAEGQRRTKRAVLVR